MHLTTTIDSQPIRSGYLGNLGTGVLEFDKPDTLAAMIDKIMGYISHIYFGISPYTMSEKGGEAKMDKWINTYMDKQLIGRQPPVNDI